MKLTVRYSPYYPPDRCWIWTVTGGYGERWQGWRGTYPEAVELGIEDLLAQDAAATQRKAVSAAVDAELARRQAEYGRYAYGKPGIRL